VRVTTPYFVPNDETLVSVIGTANVNSRSTKKDDEILAVVLDRELTSTLDAHFADDAAESASMRPEELGEVSLARQLLEALVRASGNSSSAPALAAPRALPYPGVPPIRSRSAAR
jgi:hypothetical protein